jgi:ABC-type antimicrobial peptide transport system permease subunit
MESEIVGVAVDAVYESLRDAVPPTMYLVFAQIDEDLAAAGAAPESASLTVRAAAAPPLTPIHSLTAAIAQVNPQLDLTFRAMPIVVNNSLSMERTLAILTGFSAALSLLMAAVGLYGVTSYAVSRRRAEIGIRMALGASPGAVVRQVVSRLLLLIAVGVVIGAGVSLWVSQFLASLLYGLEPRDPLTLIGAVMLLCPVGVLAGWFPAWRAARVDPMTALRFE